jgi:hypothetical protein
VLLRLDSVLAAAAFTAAAAAARPQLSFGAWRVF